MRTASRWFERLGHLRTVRVVALLGVASLLVASSCDEELGELVPCVTDTECGAACTAQCGSSDAVVSAECVDSRCSCMCDTSGPGGSGGDGGMGGGSGGGGMSGEGGTGGADTSCGADTECSQDSPSICGTICIEPICGGEANFDTARCGDDGRCECICVTGACSN